MAGKKWLSGYSDLEVSQPGLEYDRDSYAPQVLREKGGDAPQVNTHSGLPPSKH